MLKQENNIENNIVLTLFIILLILHPVVMI